MPDEIHEEEAQSLRLPRNWPTLVRSAVLNVIGIVRIAMLTGRETLIKNGDAPDARIHQLECEVAMLREELRIITLVSDDTIRDWLRRVDDDALVQTSTPVNRFPDVVRYAVQQINLFRPTLGKLKIAEKLARAGSPPHQAATFRTGQERSE